MEDGIIQLSIKDCNNQHYQTASGSFVVYKNQILVATAAHCVFDFSTKQSATEILVKYNSAGKTKECKVLNIYVNEQWMKQGLLSDDIAFCTINAIDINNVKYYVPKFDFYPQHNSKVKASGIIPSIFKDRIAIYRTNMLEEKYWISDHLLGIKTRMRAGTSGGPMLAFIGNQEKQIGVISSHFNDEPKYTWLAIWQLNAKKLLEQAVHAQEGGLNLNGY
jgi:Trypsin.